MDEDWLKLIRLLLARLERISVDSYWAHRANGVRGQLIRIIERMEAGEVVNPQTIQKSCQAGFNILDHAAREKYR